MAGENQPLQPQNSLLSRGELLLLLASTAEAICEVDINGKCTFFNAAALRMLGYGTADELLGTNFHDLIHSHHNDESRNDGVECGISAAIRRGTLMHAENEVLLKKDGSGFPAEYWSYPIFEEGHVIGSFISFFDRTARDHSVQQLIESEKMFRIISNYSADQEIFYDMEGNVIWSNKIGFSGYTFEETSTMDLILQRVVDPADYDRVAANFKRALAGVPGNNLEHKMVRKDGSVLWVSTSWRPVFGMDGRMTGIRSSTRNITQQKHIEEALVSSELKLKESIASRDRFFSILAHDLISPFQNILGFCNLMMEAIAEKEYDELGNYTRIVKNSAEKTFGLLNNLLDWSRMQTGGMEFRPEPFNLGELAQETVRLLSEYADQKSIRVTLVIPHDIQVWADKAMIATVLRNLVMNAIKFTRAGGEIRLSAEYLPGETVIRVSDNGVGIERDVIGKLFRIDQSHSTPGTNREKGTGLGLILCKDFVEKHGGKIGVESEPGAGSTFHFSLPEQNRN